MTHALELVRKAKALFKEELIDIYNCGKEAVLNCTSSFEQNNILKELGRLIPVKVKEDFEKFLNERISQYNEQKDFHNAMILIDSLKDLKIINNTKHRILLAEKLELEADNLNANKKPNTFYLDISSLYTKGLRKLKGIKCTTELRVRLEKKIKIEQRESINIYQSCGVTTQIDVSSIDKYIVEAKIDSFNPGFNFIKNLSIVTKQTVDQAIDKPSDKYFFTQFCENAERIDSQGKVAGISTMVEYQKDLFRSLHRSHTILALRRIKWIMDIDEMIDKSLVHVLLSKHKSKFIPDDRFYIFVEGLYAGFKNDFITSAHILMPQIENSLKHIANQSDITIAKLSETIQHDNTLGGVLDKISIIMDQDMYEELKSFLVDTSGVNFRNELSHGLMPPTLIDYYGIYLWSLCIKMIFKTDDIFKLPNN